MSCLSPLDRRRSMLTGGPAGRPEFRPQAGSGIDSMRSSMHRRIVPSQ